MRGFITGARWSEADTAEASRRYLAGEDVAAIGASLGRAEDGVRRRLSSLGIKGRVPTVLHRVWSADREREAVDLYLSGKSAAEVAKIMGCSRGSAIGAIHRAGIKRGVKANGSARPISAGYAKALNYAEAEANRAKAEAEGRARLRALSEPVQPSSVRLMDRKRLQCSWPVGEPDRPANQMCCGGQVREGRSTSTETYCDHHAAIALSGRQPKTPQSRICHVLATVNRVERIDLTARPGTRIIKASPWDEGRAA